jgi:hypothetical protein
MLGEAGKKGVSQAAWIRSLMASYVKRAEGPRISIGGLFGAALPDGKKVLPWSRSQQAAFLILVWTEIEDAVKKCREKWANSLRDDVQGGPHPVDPAFAGEHSLLNTDPGVRGILSVTNDLAFVRADDEKLFSWEGEPNVGAIDEKAVTKDLRSIKGQPFVPFIRDLAVSLSTYDWRTAAAPNLTEAQRVAKLVFRGSGGYRELRRQLLQHLARGSDRIAAAAREVMKRLNYT